MVGLRSDLQHEAFLRGMTDTQIAVRVKECDLCRQLIRVVTNSEGRAFAFDEPSGEDHDCWDVPPNTEILAMEDDTCCD